jgi:hypothetical protein
MNTGEAPWFFAADRDPAGSAPPASLASAQQDAALAAHLLALPPPERLHLARRDARFHRPSLLTLLNLRAESALFQQTQGATAEAAAELAATLAAALPPGAGDRTRQAAALAHWLLGKARLQRRDITGARRAFSQIAAYFADPDRPSEELALAAAGAAQVDQQSGHPEGAVLHFQRAAYLFAQNHAQAPAAGCLAETGFLLLAAGDWTPARRNLQRAWHLLDPALAPSMAARVALACAECEIQLAEGPGTGWLDRARSLYALPASPHEHLTRAWAEARVAAAAGRRPEADRLFDAVRHCLFAAGSLQEALNVSCDQVIAAADPPRGADAAALAVALRAAFPGAGDAWAAGLVAIGAIAARKGTAAAHLAANDLCGRLRTGAAVAPDRRDLLTPTAALTDRLLRHRGELEDPVGAAADL